MFKRLFILVLLLCACALPALAQPPGDRLQRGGALIQLNADGSISITPATGKPVKLRPQPGPMPTPCEDGTFYYQAHVGLFQCIDGAPTAMGATGTITPLATTTTAGKGKASVNSADPVFIEQGDARMQAATPTQAGLESAADKTKLNGIAPGATANSPDATLLARANHTGTQPLSTITGWGTAALLNAPASGNAAAGEAVKGSDTRLTDERVASGVHSFGATIPDALPAGTFGSQTVGGRRRPFFWSDNDAPYELLLAPETLPAANDVLGLNAAGSAVEGKSVVGGNGVVVTHTPGSIVIDSTSGTVQPGSLYEIGFYDAAGAVVWPDPRLTDNHTELRYTGAGGMGTGAVGTGVLDLHEGAAPPGVVTNDLLWADATNHRLRMHNNNTLPDDVVGANTLDILTNKVSIAVQDGTDNNPAFRFTNAPHTGLYYAGGNELAVSINSTGVFSFFPAGFFLQSSSGEIGIGSDASTRLKRSGANVWDFYDGAVTHFFILDGPNEHIKFGADAGIQRINNGGSTTALMLNDGSGNGRTFFTPLATDTFASSFTFNGSDSNVQQITLTGDITTLTLTGLHAGAEYILSVVQDATGGHTIAWGTKVKWAGGTAPTLSTAPNARDIFKFVALDFTKLYEVSRALDVR